MRTATIHFDDGSSITTNINGSDKEIQDYYIGTEFVSESDSGRETRRIAIKVAIEFDPLLADLCWSKTRVVKSEARHGCNRTGFIQIQTKLESEMNDSNFTGIRMKKQDWNRIPAYFRKIDQIHGRMVLAAGHFTPVLIVD